MLSVIVNSLVRYFFGPDAEQPLNQPRPLEDRDYLGWNDALDARASAPMKPRTIEDVQALVRMRNPLRWWRVRRDFRWVQKEMKKMGLNPEDARYIL